MKKLKRLLEELGAAAAEPVATSDANPVEHTPKIENTDTYPADEHKQAEEVKGLVIENAYPFAHVNDNRTGLNESNKQLQEEPIIRTGKGKIVIDLPYTSKTGLSKLEEQLMVESLLTVSNILSKKTLTEEEVATEIKNGAKAEIDLTDNGVKVTVHANDIKPSITTGENKELHETVLLIDAILSEDFSPEYELDRVVELTESLALLPLTESSAFVDSLNEDELFLLETTLDQYNTLLEIGVGDALKVGMGKVKDFFVKRGMEKDARKDIKSAKTIGKGISTRATDRTKNELKNRIGNLNTKIKNLKSEGNKEAVEKARLQVKKLKQLVKPKFFMSSEQKKKFDNWGASRSVSKAREMTDTAINKRKEELKANKTGLDAKRSKQWKNADIYDRRGGKAGAKAIAAKAVNTKKEKSIDSLSSRGAMGRPIMDTPSKSMIKFGGK